jgi:hypothetical protein
METLSTQYILAPHTHTNQFLPKPPVLRNSDQAKEHICTTHLVHLQLPAPRPPPRLSRNRGHRDPHVTTQSPMYTPCLADAAPPPRPPSESQNVGAPRKGPGWPCTRGGPCQEPARPGREWNPGIVRCSRAWRSASRVARDPALCTLIGLRSSPMVAKSRAWSVTRWITLYGIQGRNLQSQL